MDQAGLEVRDVELAPPGIEGDVAERRAGILASVERDLGEGLGLVAVGGGETVDGAGAAAGAPLALEPAGIVGVAVEAEGRGRGHVDVGRVGVVEGDAEHLADLGRGRLEEARLVQPMPAIGGKTGRPEIERDAGCAREIDDGARTLGRFDRGRAGEFRDESRAARQAVLGGGGRSPAEHDDREKRDKTDAPTMFPSSGA